MVVKRGEGGNGFPDAGPAAAEEAAMARDAPGPWREEEEEGEGEEEEEEEEVEEGEERTSVKERENWRCAEKKAARVGKWRASASS